MTLPKPFAIGLSALGIVGVWAIDRAIGPEVSVLLFHLPPVLLGTWFAGATWGVGLALLMALLSWFGAPGPGSAVNLLDIASDFAATVLIVWMQSKLRALYQRAREAADSDSLTGLLNRSGLRQPLQREIERAKRYGHAFSLLYLDCDNFKAVNDGLGHSAGDAVLVAVGSALQAGVRRVDAAARVGGDEFVEMLSEADTDAARATARHVKSALDAAMAEHGFPVTFSIGVVTFARAPDHFEEALTQADAAMYEAKNGGKDSITWRQL